MENALYSQAIKNYLCFQTDDKDLKAYLEILKVSSNRVPADLTKKLNKAIVNCNSTGIKYLLLSIQLGVTRFEENQNLLNKKIYFKLIKEFEKVPESCRKNAAGSGTYRGDAQQYGSRIGCPEGSPGGRIK